MRACSLPFLIVLSLLNVAPRTAEAQTTATRGVEVFGAAGPGQMWDDEGYLGVAMVWAGGAGYRVGPLGVEVGVDHRRHQPDFNNDVIFKAHGTRVMVRALYYFRRPSPVQPYAGGGLGYASVWRFSEFPSDCRLVDHTFVCESVERFQSTDRSRAVAAVAGVRFLVDERWFVRPEFEMGHSQDSLTMAWLVVAGRAW
jgi:opacity protein-like surface antigen